MKSGFGICPSLVHGRQLFGDDPGKTVNVQMTRPNDKKIWWKIRFSDGFSRVRRTQVVLFFSSFPPSLQSLRDHARATRRKCREGVALRWGIRNRIIRPRSERERICMALIRILRSEHVLSRVPPSTSAGKLMILARAHHHLPTAHTHTHTAGNSYLFISFLLASDLFEIPLYTHILLTDVRTVRFTEDSACYTT